MGRPQEFDAAEVLRRAMHVFWNKGYEAASLADILAATRLSKSSLYATFGGKRALFLAAFDAYRAARLRHLKLALCDGRPERQSIEGFFRQVVVHNCEPAQAYGCMKGCMTANEAVELAPHDGHVQRLVVDDFQAVEDAFAAAVERGQAGGSIASRATPRALARFLVMGLQGLQVMARGGTDRTRLDDAVTVMLSALD